MNFNDKQLAFIKQNAASLKDIFKTRKKQISDKFFSKDYDDPTTEEMRQEGKFCQNWVSFIDELISEAKRQRDKEDEDDEDKGPFPDNSI